MGKLLSALRGRWAGVYRRSSIQLILSLTFTAAAVAGMVFLGMSLFLRFSSATNTQMAQTSQRILSQVNLNLDAYLRGMMRVSDAAYYQVIKGTDLGKEALSQELELLYQSNRDHLVSIAVFTEEGRLEAAAPLGRLKPGATPQGEGWFSAAREQMENLHFSTPHVQDLFVDPDHRYRWVVSLSRQVELTRWGAVEKGVLLVDMNYGGIEQLCKDVDLGSGQGYLYLVDRDGEIIYHPRQQLIYARLLEENNQTAAGYADGSHNETFQGQRRQVTVKTVGYTGWKLIGVVPEENPWDNYGELLLFFLFVVLFSIYLLVFVNLRLSAWITAPLKKLDRAVKELEAGAEQVDLDVGGPYEVEHVLAVWDSGPRHLGEENKKFVFGQIREGARARDYRSAITWLAQAGLAVPVRRVSKPGMPLAAYADDGAFKLFLLDVGLLGALSGLKERAVIEGSAIFTEFKGSLTEQYVCQQLLSGCGLAPYYWSAENGRSEIDFLVQSDEGTFPIEVKAEENLRSKSLRTFAGKYPDVDPLRFSMSPFRVESWMRNIPLYALQNRKLWAD